MHLTPRKPRKPGHLQRPHRARHPRTPRRPRTLRPTLSLALAAPAAIAAATGGGLSDTPAGHTTARPATVAAAPSTVPNVPRDDDQARTWPVRGTTGTGPPILRGWHPPTTPYGPGHRGIDLAAPPGTHIHAPAPGRISYTGRIAHRGVLTIDHHTTGDPPLRTTYEPVHALVDKGDEVATGDVIGTVEPQEKAKAKAHCTQPCLHWGLRRGTTYLNPLTLLPTSLVDRGPSRLLPVWGCEGG
ncbi:murein hydrolase activator EnvC family protein [Streptomyces cavernicola]|uniref:M23 family metallopeptidase n=1 Tax=Streptomyces cavernicola TaxID=3043613 RepID=A0ABT6SE08_9ACTN|nr:M23 family metallopeptidase [Streptomyces sp. B-S-A6]MDI3406069.1 M23 family metallopeptidase [Streptomyces sp. B-S-A6]